MPGRTLPFSRNSRLSGESRMTAPRSRCKSMQFFRTMGPVRKTPSGTNSVPPPCLSSAAMALRNASVLDVTPSETPPKSVSVTCLSGITTRATSAPRAKPAASSTKRKTVVNFFIAFGLLYANIIIKSVLSPKMGTRFADTLKNLYICCAKSGLCLYCLSPPCLS